MVTRETKERQGDERIHPGEGDLEMTRIASMEKNREGSSRKNLIDAVNRDDISHVSRVDTVQGDCNAEERKKQV